jgi:hypothetical protein
MKHFEQMVGCWLALCVGLGCGGDPGATLDAGVGGEGAAGPGVSAQVGSGAGQSCASPAYFASEVVEVAYGPGQSFGRDRMPEVALGPPVGGGCCQGSLDVVSLGNGGTIVVGFGGSAIVDGPGPDFVVFENAFETADTVFAEIASVEVSEDGMHWDAYPCTADAPPYGTCAGQQPVYLDAGPGPVDPSSSGGDAFDLADLGLARVRFVRITDRADLTGAAGVFDLDAVGVVHAACP